MNASAMRPAPAPASGKSQVLLGKGPPGGMPPGAKKMMMPAGAFRPGTDPFHNSRSNSIVGGSGGGASVPPMRTAGPAPMPMAGKGPMPAPLGHSGGSNAILAASPPSRSVSASPQGPSRPVSLGASANNAAAGLRMNPSPAPPGAVMPGGKKMMMMMMMAKGPPPPGSGPYPQQAGGPRLPNGMPSPPRGGIPMHKGPQHQHQPPLVPSPTASSSPVSSARRPGPPPAAAAGTGGSQASLPSASPRPSSSPAPPAPAGGASPERKAMVKMPPSPQGANAAPSPLPPAMIAAVKGKKMVTPMPMAPGGGGGSGAGGRPSPWFAKGPPTQQPPSGAPSPLASHVESGGAVPPPSHRNSTASASGARAGVHPPFVPLAFPHATGNDNGSDGGHLSESSRHLPSQAAQQPDSRRVSQSGAGGGESVGREQAPSRASSPSRSTSGAGGGHDGSRRPQPPFQIINGKKAVFLGGEGVVPVGPPAAMAGAKKMIIMGSPTVTGTPPPPSLSRTSSPSQPSLPTPLPSASVHAPGQELPKAVPWMVAGSGAPPPGTKMMLKGPPPGAKMATIASPPVRGGPQLRKPAPRTTTPTGDGVMRVPSPTVLRDDAPEAGLAKPDAPRKALKPTQKKKKLKKRAGGGSGGISRFGALALDDSDEDSDDDGDEGDEEEEEEEGAEGASESNQRHQQPQELHDGDATPGYHPDGAPSPLEHQTTESFGDGQARTGAATATMPTGEDTALADADDGNSRKKGEGNSDVWREKQATDGDDEDSKDGEVKSDHTDVPSPAPKKPPSRKDSTHDSDSRAALHPRHRPSPKTSASGRAKALKAKDEAEKARARQEAKQRAAHESRREAAVAKRRQEAADAGRLNAKGDDRKGKITAEKEKTHHRHHHQAEAERGRPRSASRSTRTGPRSSTASPSRAPSSSPSSSPTSRAGKRRDAKESAAAVRRSRSRRRRSAPSRPAGQTSAATSSGSSPAAYSQESSPLTSRSSSSASSRLSSVLRGTKASDLYRLYNLLKKDDTKASAAVGARRRGSTPRRQHLHRRHRENENEVTTPDRAGSGGSRHLSHSYDEGVDSWLKRHRRRDPSQRHSPFSSAASVAACRRGSEAALPTSLGSVGVPWRTTNKHPSAEPFDPPSPLTRPLGYINTGGGRYARLGELGNSPYAQSPRRRQAAPSSTRRRLSSPLSSPVRRGETAHADPAAASVTEARARAVVDAVQADPLHLRSPHRAEAVRAAAVWEDVSFLSSSSAANAASSESHPYCLSKPPPYVKLSQGNPPFNHLSPLRSSGGRGAGAANGADDGVQAEASSLLQDASRALDVYLTQKQQESRRHAAASLSPSPSTLARGGGAAPSFFDQLYIAHPSRAGAPLRPNAAGTEDPRLPPDEAADVRTLGGSRSSGASGVQRSSPSLQEHMEADAKSSLHGTHTPLPLHRRVGSTSSSVPSNVNDEHNLGGGRSGAPLNRANSLQAPSPLIPSAVDVLTRDLAESHAATERNSIASGGSKAPSAALQLGHSGDDDDAVDDVLHAIPPPLPATSHGEPPSKDSKERSQPGHDRPSRASTPGYARPRSASTFSEGRGQGRSRSVVDRPGRRLAGAGGGSASVLLSPPRPASASSAPRTFSKATADRLARPSRAAAAGAAPMRPHASPRPHSSGVGMPESASALAIPGVAAEKRRETKQWLDEVLSSVALAGDGKVLLQRLDSGTAGATHGKKVPLPLVDYRKEFRPITTTSGRHGASITSGRGFLRKLDEAAKADATPESPRHHVSTIDFSRMQGVRSPVAAPPSGRADEKGRPPGHRTEVVVNVSAPADGLPFEAYSTIKVKEPQLPSAWARAPPRDGFDFAPGRPIVRKVISARSAAGSSGGDHHHHHPGEPPRHEDGAGSTMSTSPRRLVQEVWLDEHKQPYVKVKEIPCGEAAKAQRLAMQRLSRPKPVYVRAEEAAGGGH